MTPFIEQERSGPEHAKGGQRTLELEKALIQRSGAVNRACWKTKEKNPLKLNKNSYFPRNKKNASYHH
jgi:hypothetical protein